VNLATAEVFLMIHLMQDPLSPPIARSGAAIAGSDPQTGAAFRDYSDMLYDQEADEENEDPQSTLLDLMVAVALGSAVALGALILGSINLLKSLHGG
jgi:hypothetical protein